MTKSVNKKSIISIIVIITMMFSMFVGFESITKASAATKTRPCLSSIRTDINAFVTADVKMPTNSKKDGYFIEVYVPTAKTWKKASDIFRSYQRMWASGKTGLAPGTTYKFRVVACTIKDPSKLPYKMESRKTTGPIGTLRTASGATKITSVATSYNKSTKKGKTTIKSTHANYINVVVEKQDSKTKKWSSFETCKISKPSSTQTKTFSKKWTKGKYKVVTKAYYYQFSERLDPRPYNFPDTKHSNPNVLWSTKTSSVITVK